MNKHQLNEETDLFQLLDIFWARKWTLVSIISTFVVLGLGFVSYKNNNLPSKHYVVSASFQANLYSLLTEQLCQNELLCIERRMADELFDVVGNEWDDDPSLYHRWRKAGLNLPDFKNNCLKKNKDDTTYEYCIAKQVEAPLELAEYNKQLAEYNQLITKKILMASKVDNKLIFKLLTSQNSLGSEFKSTLSESLINETVISSLRLITAIENGQSAINFGPVSIKEVHPPRYSSLVLALFIIVGCFLGCGFILVTGVVTKRP